MTRSSSKNRDSRTPTRNRNTRTTMVFRGQYVPDQTKAALAQTLNDSTISKNLEKMNLRESKSSESSKSSTRESFGQLRHRVEPSPNSRIQPNMDYGRPRESVRQNKNIPISQLISKFQASLKNYRLNKINDDRIRSRKIYLSRNNFFGRKN